jgi:hypothetical protein
VSPSTGSLKSGASVTITVTTVGNGPLTYQNPLTVSPGPVSVTALYPPRG